MIKSVLIGLALMLGCGLAHAESVRAGDLSIENIWSREMPPVAPTAAAYFVIRNQGGEADTLLSASTPVAGRAELHEHVAHGEMMKMQQVSKIEIPAGAAVELKPMGYHVMLFDLKQQARAGDTFSLTLEFSKAGKVELQVPVKNAEQMKGAEQHH